MRRIRNLYGLYTASISISSAKYVCAGNRRATRTPLHVAPDLLKLFEFTGFRMQKRVELGIGIGIGSLNLR